MYYICSAVSNFYLPISSKKYSKPQAEKLAAQKTYRGCGLKYVAIPYRHFATAPIATSAESFRPRTSR